MSSVTGFLLREKVKEKRRREEQKKEQEQETKPRRRREDSPQPYAWRESLQKRKDPPKKSPPSRPKDSKTSKYASPIQKMLRRSPSSSKPRESPSTPINSKWITRSLSTKPSSNHATKKRSNMARITQESPPKSAAIKAAANEDSDDSDSDDSILAHIEKREKKQRQDSKENSQESANSASGEDCKRDSPRKKSVRTRSLGSTFGDASSSEGECERCTDACCKSRRHGSNRNSCCGDSDSLSEEESHGRKPNKQKLRHKRSPQKRQGRRGIHLSSEEEVEDYSSDDSDRKSRGRKSTKTRSNRKHIDSEIYSCSEDKEPPSSSSLRGGKRGRKKEGKRRNSYYNHSEDSSSSDEVEKPASCNSFPTSSDDDSSDDEAAKKKAARPVMNPFTVAQQQQQSLESIAANCARPANQDDDHLWVDGDEKDGSREAEKSKAKKSKKQSRSKPKRSSKASNESSVEWSSPSKKGGMSYWYLPNTDDRYEMRKLLQREDEDALQSIIHPEFEHPEWLHDYEALELGTGTGARVSVPPSLSRYLAAYQKEGIRFMHDCLAKKSGTVMGDDMGLGKTVQVIGLLCALFQKTGTGVDLLRIHRRHKLIMEQREMAIREEQKANLDGRLYMPKKIDMKSLDLPPWYPVLIIVPPTVVENWQCEFERFSNFAVAVFSGSKDVRNRELDKVRDGRAEVLLAAKSLFQETEGAFKHLNEISWKLVIIDEFHTFKSVKGNVAKNLRELKTDHQPLVVGMTGTLMQNDHKELWNLIDLVQTNHLGSWKDFEVSTARAIKLGRQKGANGETIATCRRKSIALEEHLAKLFISRKKEIVLADKLTKKTVNVVLCKPSEIQKRIYAHILTLPDVQHVKMATSPCDCGINKQIFRKFYKLKSQAERVKYIRENQKHIVKRWKCCYRVPFNPRKDEEGQPLIDPDAVIWRMLEGHDEASDAGCTSCPYCVLFAVLDKLNKLSSHVGSLQADSSNARRGSPEHVRFTKELEFAKVAFPPDVLEKLNLYGGLFRQDASFNEHFALSGKMKELHKLLKRYKKEGCKVLVFSYSTKTLDFIQQYVRSQNHSFRRIDGQVNPKLRQNLCNEFNNDRNVFLFLLSTKACGLGLNLTAANKVIIFDVEWNPSWDEQAQDRAYRIGQQQDVEVIRLVTEGTIDELRYLRQLYKVQLKNETLNSSEAKSRSARVFRGIQGDRYRKGELFGTENLLKLKEDGSFLSDLWKSKSSKGKRSNSKEVAVHNADDIASNLNSDLCDKLFVADDSENASVAHVESHRNSGAYDSEDEDDYEKMQTSPRQLREAGQDDEKIMPVLPRNAQEQHQDTLQSSRNNSSDRNDDAVHKNESVDSYGGMVAGNRDDSVGDGANDHAPAADANAVNQDALYDEEQGGALYEEGDDGYDEEMGGETQNAYASYANMQLPENPQDAMFDDDDEENANHDHGQHGGGFNERIAGAAARSSASRGGAPMIQQLPANMAAGAVQVQQEMPQMQLAMPRNQPAIPADSRALSERSQRRAIQQEGLATRRTSESRIAVQLRPEPEDPSKEHFFRSRDARGSSDSDRDGAEGDRRVAKRPNTSSDHSDGDCDSSRVRVAKKPKSDNSDSDENGKKPTKKKKAPINLFGKSVKASKSNSKGNSGGLCVPTYKRPRKKKK